MPLRGFICPDGRGNVPFDFCRNECPSNCRPLPLLMFMASKERDVIPNTYHVTEIIKPSQAIYWGRRAELYQHPDDLMNMAYGSAVHYLLEDGARELDARHKVERNWRQDFETPDGMLTLSGTPDYYDSRTKTLYDYKTAGAFSLRYKKRELLERPHWQDNDYCAQLNIYRAYAYPEAERARLFFFALGWDKMCLKETKMFADTLPPINRTEAFDIELAPIETVKDWVTRRMTAIAGHEAHPETIPNCTMGDKWDRGRGPTRCNQYCSARDLCPQFEREKK